MAERPPVLTFPLVNSVRVSADLATGATLGLFQDGAAITGVATNPSIQANTEETIWDAGQTNWEPMPIGGAKLFIASESTSDTAVDVLLGFINALGVFDAKTVTLTGQTPLEVGPDIDFFSIASLADSGDPQVGDINIWHTGTATAGVPDTIAQLQGKIRVGQGLTHNGFFKVPVDKYGVDLNMTFFVGKNADFAPHLLIRSAKNYSIQRRFDFPIYQTSQQFSLKNLLLSPNTVLELRGSSSVNNALVTTVFQSLFVDKSLVKVDNVLIQSFLW